MGQSTSSFAPMQCVPKCDTARFMGSWFVIAVKPTLLETTNSNAVERYTWLDNSNHDIDIDFHFNTKEPLTSKMGSLPQKGWVLGDKKNSGDWKVSPFWPVKMPYKIIELDDQDYMYTVVGFPNRKYCWIMYRHPQMPSELYDMLTKRLVEKHQYSLDGLRQVPQVWTREEREKRGFTSQEIPDSMLETVNE
jgi:apolipoprotein D and lipocalin family protein